MTSKNFFRLVIKLFGLYSLIIFLFSIAPTTIPQLFVFGPSAEMLIIPLILLIPIVLFLLLIFKPDLIINRLKLERGFEEEKIILGDLATPSVLKLACIIIGGLMIVDVVPVLVNQLIFMFKESVQHHDNIQNDFFPLGVSIVKLFVGYLMIRNYEWVGKLLHVKE